MDTARPSRKRFSWPDAVFYGIALLVLPFVVVKALRAGTTAEAFMFAGPAIQVADVSALVLGIILWRRAGLHHRTRLAWLWLTAAAVVRIAASVAYQINENYSTFPAPGDVLRMLMVPILLGGLFCLPRGGGRLDRHKQLLDVGAVFAGGAMVMWYLVVGPALASNALPADTVAGAITMPIGDLVMIFGVLLVLRRGLDPAVRRPALLITAALLVELMSTSYLGYLRTHLLGEDQRQWQAVCWAIGHFLFATAAFEQLRTRPGGMLAQGGSVRRVSRLPYLGIGLGLALIVVAAVREAHAYPWTGLVAGMIAITLCIALRQAATLREVHEMATTDSLTALANRAHLHDALRFALVQGRRSGRRVAVLAADLNGFKQINDTMGHEAGDALLREFAVTLRRSVFGRDVVGRLGGDEFAVVMHDIGSAGDAEAVIRRLHDEMQRPVLIGDTPVQIRAAVGYALSEPGESDGDAVLRRADAAMYQVKRTEAAGV